MALLLAGRDSLCFAPNETQKQNAWLHNRTATATAETARTENTSKKLQALQEIIAGNELFKKQNRSQAAAFKQAHSQQSPLTRQIVAQTKTQAVPES